MRRRFIKAKPNIPNKRPPGAKSGEEASQPEPVSKEQPLLPNTIDEKSHVEPVPDEPFVLPILSDEIQTSVDEPPPAFKLTEDIDNRLMQIRTKYGSPWTNFFRESPRLIVGEDGQIVFVKSTEEEATEPDQQDDTCDVLDSGVTADNGDVLPDCQQNSEVAVTMPEPDLSLSDEVQNEEVTEAVNEDEDAAPDKLLFDRSYIRRPPLPDHKSKKVKRTVPLYEEVDCSTVTMKDLIYMNPTSNPMPLSPKDGDEEQDEVRNERREVEEEDEDFNVPRVTIGPDGQVILDEASLTISRRQKTVDDRPLIVLKGNNGFYRKRNSIKHWTLHETKLFYVTLSKVGTDFSLMAKTFPDRSRLELKRKFKREEKHRSELIDKALSRQIIGYDLSVFDSPVKCPPPLRVKAPPKERKSHSGPLENQKINLLTYEDSGDEAKKPKRRRKKNVEELIAEFDPAFADANKAVPKKVRKRTAKSTEDKTGMDGQPEKKKRVRKPKADSKEDKTDTDGGSKKTAVERKKKKVPTATLR